MKDYGISRSAFVRAAWRGPLQATLTPAALRQRTLDRVRQSLGHGQDERPDWKVELLATDEELGAFLNVREQSVTDLITTLARTAAINGSGTWIGAPEEFNGATSVATRPGHRRFDGGDGVAPIK